MYYEKPCCSIFLQKTLQVWPSKVKIHWGNLPDAKEFITAWLQNAPFTKYHLLRFNRQAYFGGFYKDTEKGNGNYCSIIGYTPVLCSDLEDGNLGTLIAFRSGR